MTCGRCKQEVRVFVDYDLCNACNGTGRGDGPDPYYPCHYCNRGEARIEEFMCGCDEEDEW